MSEGVYAYDSSTSENVSGDINQVISSIEATLDEMEGDMRKLSGGSWEGGEQEQYAAIHGRWSKSAHQAREVLGQVRASLDENTQSVGETRQRVTQTLAGE